jgi:hypothetical protein
MVKQFYTYIYCDPLTGKTRYAGKGYGSRAGDHLVRTHNNQFAGWIRNLRLKNLEPEIYTQDASDERHALLQEKLLIAIYGRLDLDTGSLFNHTNGGQGQSGRIYSPSAETRAKLSAAGKGRMVSEKTRALLRERAMGHTLSEQARAKIRAARTGSTLSLETRNKISITSKQGNARPNVKARIVASLMGNKRLLGHKHSLATRQKMSASRTGKKHSLESRLKRSASMKATLANRSATSQGSSQVLL